MKQSINDKIDSADFVVAVKDGKFEVLKSRHHRRGKITLPELRRLLEAMETRNG